MEKILILKETAHWIAINKTAGLNVEQLWDYPSVENQVQQYLQASSSSTKRPYVGIVHRLDRPVSGALLLAKRKQPLKKLNEQFANRSVQKVYWAITASVPEKAEGQLEHFLLKDQKQKRTFAYTQAKAKAVKASLSYKVLKQKEGLCLLEVRPYSGKFHQIRAQLATLGCPILGDYKYGAKIKYENEKIALHARSLIFKDPKTDHPQKITAPVPESDFWHF